MDPNQSSQSKRSRSDIETGSTGSYGIPTPTIPPNFNVPLPPNMFSSPSFVDQQAPTMFDQQRYTQLLQSQSPLFTSPQGQTPFYSQQQGQSSFFAAPNLPYTQIPYQFSQDPPPQFPPRPQPPPQQQQDPPQVEHDNEQVAEDPADVWVNVGDLPGSRRTSQVWTDFFINTNLKAPKAKCKHCGACYVATSGAGTGSLLKHQRKHASQRANTVQQPPVTNFFQSSNPNFKYSYEDDRKSLANMVIQSEQSFLWAEGRPFNRYVTSVQPEHKTTGRKTIRSDALKQFRFRKAMLIDEFAKFNGKINLTSDCWDAPGDLHYLCVTAHWVDDDWTLQKRIIGFQPLEYPHNAVNIANLIMVTVVEFGLKDKILTCTFDNASSNTLAVRYLVNQLGDQMLGGNLFHVRCACHILNLCVKDGLQGLSSYYDKFKVVVKTITSSKGRRQAWRNHCKSMNHKYKKFVVECDTRWNSTYEMLQSCIDLKDALTPFWNETYSVSSEIELTDDVWSHMEMYVEFLNLFHTCTKTFSLVYTPIASTFMMNLFLIGQLFAKHRDSDDYSGFLPEMESKLLKYWEDIPTIYMFASILDPRIKLDTMVIFATRFWSDMKVDYNANDFKKDIYEKFLRFYEIYDERYGRATRPMPMVRHEGESSRGGGSSSSHFGGANLFASAFSALEQTTTRQSSDLSELQMYLSFDFVKGFGAESCNLDILQWWRSQIKTFPVLGAMARDIFSVQVSSVASERAFSASGRVLDDRRRRMNSETLELCVCYKDWLDADDRKQDQPDYEIDSDDSGYATSTQSATDT